MENCRGKVYTIGACKGGVGKTTSATNLIAALQVLSPKTKKLIIDLDFQANATMAFGYNPNEITESLYDAINGKVDIHDTILHHKSGIDVVPATFDLCGLDFELYADLEGKFKGVKVHYILRELLKPLRSEYDYIICDSGPSLSIMALNYIIASDMFLIPVQTARFAYSGAAKLIHYVQQLRNKYCRDDDYNSCMFATFFEGRENVSCDILQELRKYCAVKNFHLADTTISRTVKFEKAQAYDERPLVLVGSGEKYVQEYINLAKEIFINGYK